MKRAFVLLLLALFAIAPSSQAAAKTQVKLLLSHSSAQPGETITAALQMVSEPGWHTYWRNPGDAGIATTIDWELPSSISAAPFLWPVPEKMILTKLFAYVYEKEALLLMHLTVASNAQPGSIQLKGAVNWLECSDKTCVLANGNVEATLSIGSNSQPSERSSLIEESKSRLPSLQPPPGVTATWEATDKSDTRSLLIEWSPEATVSKPDFFPFESENYTVKAATEIIAADSQKIRLRKSVQLVNGDWPAVIGGLALNQTDTAHPAAFTVELKPTPILATTASAATTAPIELAPPSVPSSIWAILGLAFLGGLILNIMPCVLPVIALKILGFVNQSREEPGRVRQLGIMYMFGVLASFLVLAGTLIGAKQAGGDVNWGMQMQNPYFLVGMTALVTLVALNLWGVFEITVSGRALGAASELAAREGKGGAFYNGVLATLLATPCTAPALAFAVGSVLTQPAHLIIITFLMIGFGLALPYVLLSWNPRWLKLLPKPGAWMEKFKIAMGFPMAATAIWLFSVASKHFGKSGTLWLGLFLLFLALAAWIYGEFFQRGSRHRPFALALAALVLISGYFYALESKLDWRNPSLASADSSEIALEPGGIPWQKWTPDAVAKTRAEGRPVLVDFTADWCLTCQVNKETSLEIDSVKNRLKEINAVPFLADFTRRNSQIAQEIKRFNRAGVPLVIVYPAAPDAAPIVLPEILTPGIVLDALESAARNKAANAIEVNPAAPLPSPPPSEQKRG